MQGSLYYNHFFLLQNLAVSETPLVCGTCWEEMQKHFNFKSKCIEAEDFLAPYFETGDVTDLIKKNQSVKSEDGQNESMCRLCMNLTQGAHELKDNGEKDLLTFLPEIVSMIM